jgi:hypothetical protein
MARKDFLLNPGTILNVWQSSWMVRVAACWKIKSIFSSKFFPAEELDFFYNFIV